MILAVLTGVESTGPIGELEKRHPQLLKGAQGWPKQVLTAEGSKSLAVCKSWHCMSHSTSWLGGYWAPVWGHWENLPGLMIPWGHQQQGWEHCPWDTQSPGNGLGSHPPETLWAQACLKVNGNRQEGSTIPLSLSQLQAERWVLANSFIPLLRGKPGAGWVLIQTFLECCFLLCLSLPSL